MFAMGAGVWLFAHFKYRGGLAGKILVWVLPTNIISGIFGYYIGYTQNYAHLPIMMLIGLPLLVGILLLFFRVVVTKLNTYGSDLLANTSQLAATAKQAAATAAQQSATVAEVSTTIEEITQTSSATAGIAQRVVKDGTIALEKGSRGIDAASEAASIMRAIGQVTDIVDLVKELAEQSNLLAVNAGIEAAKAGDHGRGFAVVASEVRNLAEQSKRATHQIKNAIARVGDGTKAIDAVAQANQELMTVLEESSDNARHIAAASSQQAMGIAQISEAMTTVSQGGKDTAETARQLETAVQSLKSISQELERFLRGNQKR